MGCWRTRDAPTVLPTQEHLHLPGHNALARARLPSPGFDACSAGTPITSTGKCSGEERNLPPSRGSWEESVNNFISRMACGVFLPALVAAATAVRAEPPKLPVPAVDQSAVG